MREQDRKKTEGEMGKKRRFLMKGDNKEPLREQMKMSFFSPPVTTTLPFVLQRDNEGEKERVSVSQQETFCWNISTLHPSLPPLFSLYPDIFPPPHHLQTTFSLAFSTLLSFVTGVSFLRHPIPPTLHSLCRLAPPLFWPLIPGWYCADGFRWGPNRSYAPFFNH